MRSNIILKVYIKYHSFLFKWLWIGINKVNYVMKRKLYLDDVKYLSLLDYSL